MLEESGSDDSSDLSDDDSEEDANKIFYTDLVILEQRDFDDEYGNNFNID